ncbi:MAG: magnesium/cobalt transporter CorA [Sandaracinaceae bacterium]|nr:magnesium/cobalt transporter CorA [Sandaracinaceae bacterium]
MSRFSRRRRAARAGRRIGATPGSLGPVGGAGPSTIRVMRYDATTLEESDRLEGNGRGRRVTWVDVIGIGSADVVRAIGERYGLHPLALEDVMHPHQRPKIEEYPDCLYVVARVPQEREGALDIEQLSMFIGADFVITFQEREGDAWDPVRERLRQAKGRIRGEGASYLAYALLDACVDAMFPLVEAYDQRLEAFEETVFASPAHELAPAIHSIDRDLTAIRRAVLPLREAVSRLIREELPLIERGVVLYLRDCQDHLSQIVDIVEAQRELVRALREAHSAALELRSGEAMKVLTIIATIFIPLSFIAGVYGMNFDREASPLSMPELGWAYGYPSVLGLMAALALGMLVYFRHRRWL